MRRKATRPGSAMYISVTCALVFVHAATLPATAHEGATGVVKERMDMMRSVAQSMKRIHNQLKLGAGLDHAAIAREAASIAGHSRDLVKKFPAGSGGGVSEAKPDIWQNPRDFTAKSEAFTAAARRLSDAAGKADSSNLTALFRDMGSTCSACHRDYRQKKTRHR